MGCKWEDRDKQEFPDEGEGEEDNPAHMPPPQWFAYMHDKTKVFVPRRAFGAENKDGVLTLRAIVPQLHRSRYTHDEVDDDWVDNGAAVTNEVTYRDEDVGIATRFHADRPVDVDYMVRRATVGAYRMAKLVSTAVKAGNATPLALNWGLPTVISPVLMGRMKDSMVTPQLNLVYSTIVPLKRNGVGARAVALQNQFEILQQMDNPDEKEEFDKVVATAAEMNARLTMFRLSTSTSWTFFPLNKMAKIKTLSPKLYPKIAAAVQTKYGFWSARRMQKKAWQVINYGETLMTTMDDLHKSASNVTDYIERFQYDTWRVDAEAEIKTRIRALRNLIDPLHDHAIQMIKSTVETAKIHMRKWGEIATLTDGAPIDLADDWAWVVNNEEYPGRDEVTGRYREHRSKNYNHMFMWERASAVWRYVEGVISAEKHAQVVVMGQVDDEEALHAEAVEMA